MMDMPTAIFAWGFVILLFFMLNTNKKISKNCKSQKDKQHKMVQKKKKHVL